MPLNLGKPKEVNRCLAPMNPNVAIQVISKRQIEKLGRVDQTLGRASRTLDDLQKNLKLNNIGMDPSKDLNSNIIVHAKLEKVFGKRKQNGQKPKPNEHLNVVNYEVILKFYEVIYSHPLDNGQYCVVFSKGWLAQHKGGKVNQTQYAYDCTQLQMKKAT